MEVSIMMQKEVKIDEYNSSAVDETRLKAWETRLIASF
jgi:hypothetical protein